MSSLPPGAGRTLIVHRRLTSAQAVHVLGEALALHRFPAFCAVLVGGSTLGQIPIHALLATVLHLVKTHPRAGELRLTRFCARFIAALLAASASFTLLNSAPDTHLSLTASVPFQPRRHGARLGPFDEPPENGSRQAAQVTTDSTSSPRVKLAGRTMDLTLFAAIRALDVVLGNPTLPSSVKPDSRLRRAARHAPTGLFCFSAATIMWAWFYSPSRLPHSYNSWISAAAELDHRLVLALRHARYGTFCYGKDTGMAPLLGSLARDLDMAEELGDPAKTIPVPCELVHMGCGKSCEKHALWRFWRGWLFAARMYFPLQLLALARHMRNKSQPGNKLAGLTQSSMLAAVGDASRRSAFLGGFVASFYYGVCLARTRLGPKLFASKTVSPQMWDSGLCVLVGCVLCGMSIFAEPSRRRLEMVLFVLPRAAATWFPRRYVAALQWREQLAFAVSAAVVLTAAQEDPRRVRGVLGSLLHRLLRIRQNTT